MEELTAGNVSYVTKMIRDHIPNETQLSTRTDLLTVHSEDTVHIVWIQGEDQACPSSYWAYANLVQTHSEALYKNHTVQSLVDQHAKSTLETSRLLDLMEKEGQAYHSTPTQSIADLKTQLQRHLDDILKLNTSLQHQLDAHKAACDNYVLPIIGRA